MSYVLLIWLTHQYLTKGKPLVIITNNLMYFVFFKIKNIYLCTMALN